MFLVGHSLHLTRGSVTNGRYRLLYLQLLLSLYYTINLIIESVGIQFIYDKGCTVWLIYWIYYKIMCSNMFFLILFDT